MISIGTAEYTLLRQLRTLENSQARRILDLLVIGSILYFLSGKKVVSGCARKL
ncbi:Uncharacterised protein [uncultured archaeon]|nr:Uncharacterised protein [uncultured archaeon]